MKRHRLLAMLASGCLLSSSAAAATLTTPLLGVGSDDDYFACYVLNVGKKAVQATFQIIDFNGVTIASDDALIPAGGIDFVSNFAKPLPSIAYCKVEFTGSKNGLRVTLCRAKTAGTLPECDSAVVTAP